MKRGIGLMRVASLIGVVALVMGTPCRAAALKFEAARLYIEYNSTDNDLGFHVFLDAEDWKSMKIVNPDGVTIVEIAGKGPYGKPNLGLSELFFEGAEPTLDTFPLNDLLAQFPEGKYKFIGVTAEGVRLTTTSTFTHAVPAGPVVSSDVSNNGVVIRWQHV